MLGVKKKAIACAYAKKIRQKKKKIFWFAVNPQRQHVAARAVALLDKQHVSHGIISDGDTADERSTNLAAIQDVNKVTTMAKELKGYISVISNTATQAIGLIGALLQALPDLGRSSVS